MRIIALLLVASLVTLSGCSEEDDSFVPPPTPPTSPPADISGGWNFQTDYDNNGCNASVLTGSTMIINQVGNNISADRYGGNCSRPRPSMHGQIIGLNATLNLTYTLNFSSTCSVIREEAYRLTLPQASATSMSGPGTYRATYVGSDCGPSLTGVVCNFDLFMTAWRCPPSGCGC